MSPVEAREGERQYREKRLRVNLERASGKTEVFRRLWAVLCGCRRSGEEKHVVAVLDP
jgi:hypothetical protein